MNACCGMTDPAAEISRLQECERILERLINSENYVEIVSIVNQAKEEIKAKGAK